MKITFGGFFRITPATIMRCGPTFRLARTHPTHARSSGLETSLRSRSLADYTIDTHESEFSEATGAETPCFLSLSTRSLPLTQPFWGEKGLIAGRRSDSSNAECCLSRWSRGQAHTRKHRAVRERNPSLASHGRASDLV